jgi:malonyl-CoA O-methyltransferase
MTILSAREGYRLWAPTYAGETAISALDEELAQTMLGGLPRRNLLDAGCGVGRRLDGGIGVDASPEMLMAGGRTDVVAADIRALPFQSARFDMVWCRLVLGHLADPLPAYRELARVCCRDGHVFVTDFHADAASAGHKRAFRDVSGVVREVEHHVHADHIKMAITAGLVPLAQKNGAVGASVRSFYQRAGRIDAYERDFGLNLVAAFLFLRPADALAD